MAKPCHQAEAWFLKHDLGEVKRVWKCCFPLTWRPARPQNMAHHWGGLRPPAEAPSGGGQVSSGVLVCCWEWGAEAVAAGPGAHPLLDYSHCPLWESRKRCIISAGAVFLVLTFCSAP